MYVCVWNSYFFVFYVVVVVVVSSELYLEDFQYMPCFILFVSVFLGNQVVDDVYHSILL
jgi:hypothetical protein